MKKFNVAIEIPDWEPLEDRIRYMIKLKGSTGKKAFLAHVQDVQDRLLLPAAVMQRFRLGWNKASRLVERMENLGIVGRPEGKLPREVIPRGPEDIPEDLSAFLTKAGYQTSYLTKLPQSSIRRCYSLSLLHRIRKKRYCEEVVMPP